MQNKQSQPQNNSPGNYEEILLQWKAGEFDKVHRDFRTSAIIFLIFFALIAYGLFTGNLLMSILFILIGFVLYAYEKKEPGTVEFTIIESGLLAQGHIYDFDSMESFWINYEPGGKKELILKRDNFFLPYLKIPLGNQDPVEAQEVLSEFLPEKEHIDPISKFLEKYF
ncbi:MAG: hypothetical protein U5L10_00635 [Candidatus Moranbacteria bacterium]|nr:hypothetical protein [Candidatus Moranbacteria bacterium]